MGRYYKNSIKQVKFLKTILDIQEISRGVDIGCGEGEHLKELQQISPYIYGVDIEDHTQVENFFQLNVFESAIPLQDLDFAYVLSPYFAEDWWNIESFFQNVSKSLKIDGHFVLDLFDFNAMKEGQRRSTYRILKSVVVLSTFTRQADRVILDRTIIDFEGTQKKVSGVWRIFTQHELVSTLASQGFMVINQYSDFESTSVINWDTNIQDTKRLIIHAKKYRE